MDYTTNRFSHGVALWAVPRFRRQHASVQPIDTFVTGRDPSVAIIDEVLQIDPSPFDGGKQDCLTLRALPATA